MEYFARIQVHFLLLCLILHFPAFSEEDDPRDEPSIFTFEQLCALTSDEEHLIGGIISPLSGNLCLRQRDLTATGAQDISLSRVYLSPYMPHVFHKKSDVDGYHRRIYIMQHYEGWKYFPHLRLWFDIEKQEVHVTNPNAAVYDFCIAGSNTTLRHSYAISNLGSGEIPSGKFDPRNTRISYENSCFTIFSPDGSTRYYRHRRGRIFLLDKEILPNGKIIKYHYTDRGELSLVESCDLQERYVYASICVQGSPREGNSRFLSSTALEATYAFEARRVQGKYKEGKRKGEYSFILPPVMTTVHSPHYREEISTHSDSNCLLTSFSGKDKIFKVSHAPFGTRGKAHLRVDKLLFPVGPNDSFVPVYEMSYQPPVAGKKKGKTTVKNCNGTSTVYHFSKDLLTTLIQYFGKDGTLKKEKIFTWNDQNWLASLELRDGNKQLLLRKDYEYDAFGNPITETLTGDLQGEGLKDQNVIKREFSQDGRNLLLREETEEGKITLFEYLPGTNLVTQKIIKDRNRILICESFHYDECNNLIQSSISDGKAQKRLTNYILRQEQPFLHMPEWIEEKYLEKDSEKLLSRIHLTYDQWGNVAEEKVNDASDAYVYSILREYDEQGNLLSETNPLNQRRTFDYDGRGHCLEETNFSQNQNREMRYDEKGRLRKYKALGKDGTFREARYAYDFNDHLTQKTDSYQNVISYEYDPLSQQVIKTDFPSIVKSSGQATSVSTSSTYDSLGRETSTTDANGRTTFYKYNAYGLPIKITYPNDSKEVYRYTKDGKVASYTDRDGLTITYVYDVLGRVLSKQYNDTLGEETYSYDSFHLLEETDLDGHVTSYSYDGAGRKIGEEKCGRLTKYVYDGLGRVATTSQEDLRTHFKRDLLGRVLEESKSDATGKLLCKIGYGYTEDGDLSEITRTIGGKEAVESYRYDSFGRTIETQDPYGNGTTTVYNENYTNRLGQNVLQVTTIDPQSITTIETKDPFQRTVRQQTLGSQGVIIASWEKSYDPNGNVTDWKEYVHEDGYYHNTQRTHFAYTKDNKLASTTRGFGTVEATTTSYTYTPNGRVETKTLPDGTILSYSYNPLGFLSKLTSSDGSIKHRFECNKSGELLVACDEVENIAIQREVDPFGNVTRELFPNNIEMEKSYDAFDRLTSLHISNLGSVSYTYDPLFLRSVDRFDTEHELQYTHHYEKYDLNGNLLSENMILDSGKIDHHFDLKGRKSEMYSPYFSQKCSYDECDNLIQSVIDDESISYTYDDLSQLTSEDTTNFGYDSVYNRVEKDDEYFETNSLNELIDQAYDLNGNQIEKEDIHFVYDPLNRLREATFGNQRVHFLYDPLGRCLTKIVLKKKSSSWREIDRENYLYNGQQEMGALAADGTLNTFRVLGARIHSDLPSTIAIEIGKKLFAPLTDVQGSICRLIDPKSKRIKSSYTFSAFGEGKKSQKDKNPWRYASKRIDPDLQLINFGKRYYDPVSARWLTPDPSGFTDSLNLYQYVFNNPFRYYDPNGEFAFAIPLLIWGAELILPSFSACVVPVVYGMVTGVVAYGGYKAVQGFNEFAMMKQESPPYDGKELGSDSTKCPGDGFEWKGEGNPGSKRGSWYNSQTGEQLYPDLNHPAPIKPHWDYYGPDFPDGARLNTDGTWGPK